MQIVRLSLKRLLGGLVLSFLALPVLAAEAWETVHPGGETSCALGTPYSFHARRADPERLVVFFNGGGACWAGQTCDPSVEPTTYVPSAEAGHNDPRNHNGIFDLDNPANPLRDWSMLFVSYCTGDVHLGDVDRLYSKPDGSEITILHRGHTNAHAALDWMKENFTDAKEVLVAGSSAGSVAAPVYAGVVAKIYPDARIRELGDGSGGYTGPKVADLFTAWGTLDFLPDWAKRDDGTVGGFNGFYTNVAAHFPDISFAQYDAANDKVQLGFQKALDGNTDIHASMMANRAALAAEIDGYVSYTAGGAEHTILRAEYFYTYSANGVLFVDWLSNLISGKTPETVDCEGTEAGCDLPPS
ncbi:MAG: hypothetical protein COA62_13580 [Rhodobiaceae bacterium]|nr:MAG: hypothetical protein COA62_13580 [Rhodobiaceae bacterium]